MLVLALDTATPAVTAGLVELTGPDRIRPRAVRVHHDPRAHAELLTPQIVECLREAGVTAAELTAVVAGVGPGPFRGLRVGLATALAYADARAIPVYGVCSLDGIASVVAERSLLGAGELLVVTDARRREVYWARYRSGTRIAGPAVCRPAEVVLGAAVAVAGSPVHASLFGLPVVDVAAPTPVGLVACAASAVLAGTAPDPLVPLYLRRPDAAEPKAAVR